MADSSAWTSNLPSSLDDPNLILHLLAYTSAFGGRECTLICVVSLVCFSFALHRRLITFKPGCQLLSGFHKSSMECKILGGTVQGAAVHIAPFLLLWFFFFFRLWGGEGKKSMQSMQKEKAIKFATSGEGNRWNSQAERDGGVNLKMANQWLPW